MKCRKFVRKLAVEMTSSRLLEAMAVEVVFAISVRHKFSVASLPAPYQRNVQATNTALRGLGKAPEGSIPVSKFSSRAGSW